MASAHEAQLKPSRGVINVWKLDRLPFAPEAEEPLVKFTLVFNTVINM
jgi:hypothetical protein